MRINNIMLYQHNKSKNLSFNAGQTTLITDFDFTFSPKAFDDNYRPIYIKSYKEIAEPYFKKFSDLQKKLKDSFKIFISTGRKQGAGYHECESIFDNFEILKEENRPKIDGVIENNGETFFNVENHNGKIILNEDKQKNEKRNIVREQLKEKKTGQEVAKDLDVVISLKEAKENNDLVIVSGDGTNDRSFLNIYSYIELPKGTKIPQTAKESESLLASMPDIKKQISDLPVKIIIMEGDCSKEEYYKYLVKTFPNKYKTGKQAIRIGEAPLFDNIETSIEEYTQSNKKYADALKNKRKKNTDINKLLKIFIPIFITICVLSFGIGFLIYNKEKNKKKP